MTTGTLFLMWLGEQITERGIGNGISMLILSGIVAGLPGAVGRTVRVGEHRGNAIRCSPSLVIALVFGVTGFLRFRRARAAAYSGKLRQAPGRPAHVRRAEQPPAVQAQHVGRDPADLRLEPAAVPGDDGELLRQPARRPGSGCRCRAVQASLGYGQPLHLVLYAALIFFFCFFYTALVFNARETADNLKKSGAFIPGIRPGQQTGEYIDKVLTRLTLWGALYVMAVCLMPEILVLEGVPFQFGGTSLLIVVVVVMDFMAQLQAHLMSHHYPGLMKKANLLGRAVAVPGSLGPDTVRYR